MSVLIVPCLRLLAVRQPFANRIASGKKPFEFRSWTTDYRGPVLIVASGTPWKDEARNAAELEPRSCAICIVDLVDVSGRVGFFDWKLKNPRRVRAVKLRPRLNLGYPSAGELAALAGVVEVRP